MNKSRVITIGTAAAALALTAGTASAATLITSHDIKDHTIHRVDLAGSINRSLSMARQPGTAGTVYRVAHYTNGAGGNAVGTVACADTESKSQKYVAVAGGVQVINADGDNDFSNDNAVAVADSFPGRMDWSNNTPKPGRLDGWIVRWGDATKSAAKVNVWAVCMRRSSDVQTQTTNY
jgi:hypothetical protein